MCCVKRTKNETLNTSISLSARVQMKPPKIHPETQKWDVAAICPDVLAGFGCVSEFGDAC